MFSVNHVSYSFYQNKNQKLTITKTDNSMLKAKDKKSLSLVPISGHRFIHLLNSNSNSLNKKEVYFFLSYKESRGLFQKWYRVWTPYLFCHFKKVTFTEMATLLFKSDTAVPNIGPHATQKTRARGYNH